MIVYKEQFGENRHIKFKEKIPTKHENFLKDIIAFANSSGGKTIIDKKEFRGPIQQQVKDAYRFVLRHINRNCRLTVQVQIKERRKVVTFFFVLFLFWD